MAGKFEVYEDRAGKFRFRLKAGNGEVLATGEAYDTETSALRATYALTLAAVEAAAGDALVAPPVFWGRQVSEATTRSLGESSWLSPGDEVLYIEFELGTHPSFSKFAEQVAALDSLARFVGAERVALVRTSLSSPWATVLAEVASTYAPVGYGAAGLFGLQKLLDIVMDFQKSRINIAEGRLRLKQATDELVHSQTGLSRDPDEIDDAVNTMAQLEPVRIADLRRADEV